MIPTSFHLQQILRFALSVAIFLGLIVLSLTAYIVLQFDGTFAGEGECALVFGAAIRRGDTAGPGIERRVNAAVALVERGLVSKLYFTGGQGSEGQSSEAAVMRKYAMLQGIDPEMITLEQQSRSTWENLQLSQPLLADCAKVVAVSDRYHLARIGFLAHLQGWTNLQLHPATPAPWYFELRSTVREAVGILYYAVMELRM